MVLSKWADDEEGDEYYADGIYAYDTRINDWNKIIDYPDNLTTNSHTTLYHKGRNSIFILNAQPQFLQFDLTTKTMKCLHENIEGFGSYPGLVLVDNNIHMIGRSGSEHIHNIYNCKNSTIAPSVLPDKGYSFYTKSVTYLESKNIILIFDDEEDKIHEYSLSNHNWIERKVNIPMYAPAIAATRDDRNIIVIGGENIFIYNVDENVFVKSKVKSPTKTKCRAIIMDNVRDSDLLVFGYLKNAFDGLVPLDVMNMITNWIKYQDLHLIQNLDGQHWKIDVAKILQSKDQ